MAFRLFAMSLGGKLSLGYLLVASVLFVFGGRESVWFLMVLGFPLIHAPWLYEQGFGKIGPLSPASGISLLAILWVSNAYFWGHSVAAVVNWFGRLPKAPSGSECGSEKPQVLG